MDGEFRSELVIGGANSHGKVHHGFARMVDVLDLALNGGVFFF